MNKGNETDIEERDVKENNFPGKYAGKIQNALFIAVFMLIIVMPILANVFGLNSKGSSEKRTMAKMPQFSLKTFNKYPQQFETYFNDNFGLRDTFIEGNSYFNVKFLGVATTDKVVIGKDRWLFYNSKDDGQNISLYRGLNKFSEKELKKIKTNLEQRKSWLEAQGIPFIIMVAPNKVSIYPEYLPGNIKKVEEETRLDQLVNYLKVNSQVTILDLRKTLIENKDKGRLYYKTDTHWNNYGAFLAYSELMQEINKFYPEIAAHSFNDYQVLTKNKVGGDLSIMLNLKMVLTDEAVEFKPKFNTKAKSIESDIKLSKGVVNKTEDSTLPKLLMCRDSFSTAMIPFLSEHFSESYYNWTHSFDAEVISEIKPDIVVHEIVERHLPALLEDNQREVKEFKY